MRSYPSERYERGTDHRTYSAAGYSAIEQDYSPVYSTLGRGHLGAYQRGCPAHLRRLSYQYHNKYRMRRPRKRSNSTIPSPCCQLCELNDDDICVGCGRTFDEIRDWLAMDDEERLAVLSRLTINKNSL